MTAPTIKTAQEISAVFIAALEAQLSQTIPLMPKAFIRIFAKVMGLVFVVLYQFSESITLQLFVSTASDADLTIGGQTFNPLDEWGRLIGLTRGTGQRTEGTADVTVLVTGDTVQSGTRLLDADTGELYLVIGDTVLSANPTEITVRSVSYSTAATLYVGQILSFVSAPATVIKNVTVTAVSTQGADPETTDEWRNRQLEWWAARPQGGAYADYRDWGSAVAGVLNIYPYSGGTDGVPTSGPGQIDLYVEASGETDGTAPQALLNAVLAYVEPLAPVNKFINVVSISRSSYDVTVNGLLITSGLDSVQNDVETAIENYMLSREPYIDGLTLLPRKNVISASEMAGIVGRIAAANGGTVGSVSLYTGGSAVDNAILGEGVKAKIGTVTFA